MRTTEAVYGSMAFLLLVAGLVLLVVALTVDGILAVPSVASAVCAIRLGWLADRAGVKAQEQERV